MAQVRGFLLLLFLGLTWSRVHPAKLEKMDKTAPGLKVLTKEASIEVNLFSNLLISIV